MLKWWIQTSGLRADYRFLGACGEPDRWWAPYLRYSAPEERMLVVETGIKDDTGIRWRLYATAMPTGRRDGASPPRDIRVSILLEGFSEDAQILADVLTGYFNHDALANAIKKEMPESMVEEWLLGQNPSDDVLEKIKKALAVVPFSFNDNELPSSRHSYGNANDSTAQRLLTGLAKSDAKNNELGIFCWLNLLADPKNSLLIPNVKDANRVIVLLDDGNVDEDLIPWPDDWLAKNSPSNGGQMDKRKGDHANKKKRENVQNSSRFPMLILTITLLGLVSLILIFHWSN